MANVRSERKEQYRWAPKAKEGGFRGVANTVMNARMYVDGASFVQTDSSKAWRQIKKRKEVTRLKAIAFQAIEELQDHKLQSLLKMVKQNNKEIFGGGLSEDHDWLGYARQVQARIVERNTIENVHSDLDEDDRPTGRKPNRRGSFADTPRNATKGGDDGLDVRNDARDMESPHAPLGSNSSAGSLVRVCRGRAERGTLKATVSTGPNLP